MVKLLVYFFNLWIHFYTLFLRVNTSKGDHSKDILEKRAWKVQRPGGGKGVSGEGSGVRLEFSMWV